MKAQKNFKKQDIFYKLINAEMNKELLQGVPHRRFMDLAAIYYTPMDVGILIISNDICKQYGINQDMLEYMVKELDFTCMSIANILKTLMPAFETEEIPAYVFTNQESLFGATVMLYPHVFDKLADFYQSDLYILPSSIHEVIASPVTYYGTDFNPAKLQEMVKDINRTVVGEQDFLSDSVYLYDRKRKKIFMISDEGGLDND